MVDVGFLLAVGRFFVPSLAGGTAVGAGDDPHAVARAAVVQQYSVASTRRYLADALAGQGSRYDDAFHTHADVR
jgi:hypothetical protein